MSQQKTLLDEEFHGKTWLAKSCFVFFSVLKKWRARFPKSPSINRKLLILQDDPQGRLGDERPPGELRCQETSFLQTQCDEVNQVSVEFYTSVIIHTHTYCLSSTPNNQNGFD